MAENEGTRPKLKLGGSSGAEGKPEEQEGEGQQGQQEEAQSVPQHTETVRLKVVRQKKRPGPSLAKTGQTTRVRPPGMKSEGEEAEDDAARADEEDQSATAKLSLKSRPGTASTHAVVLPGLEVPDEEEIAAAVVAKDEEAPAAAEAEEEVAAVEEPAVPEEAVPQKKGLRLRQEQKEQSEPPVVQATKQGVEDHVKKIRRKRAASAVDAGMVTTVTSLVACAALIGMVVLAGLGFWMHVMN